MKSRTPIRLPGARLFALRPMSGRRRLVPLLAALALPLAAAPAGAFTLTFSAADFGLNPTFSDVQSFSFSIEIVGPLVPGVYSDPALVGVDYQVNGTLTPGTPSGFPAFALVRSIGGAEFYTQGSSLDFEISATADLSDGLQASELVGGVGFFVFNGREVGTGRYHPSLFELNSDGTGLMRNSNNMGGINPGSGEVVDVQIGDEYVTELTFDPSILTLAEPVPCDDGVDNDADGLVDALDPGCADPFDLSELNPLVECDDGADNDGDTFIDHLNDPECTGPTDTTEAPSVCPIVPDECSESALNVTLIKDTETPDDGLMTGTRAKVVFKWVKGSLVPGVGIQQDDFSDPVNGDDVHLCFYENGSEVMSMTAPGGGPWLEIPGKGFRYVDPTLSNDGILKVILKGGDPDKGKVVLIGKGANLPVPSLPRGGSSTYDVQLHIDGTSECYGMSYDAGASNADVFLNKDVGVFKLKRRGL